MQISFTVHEGKEKKHEKDTGKKEQEREREREREREGVDEIERMTQPLAEFISRRFT